MDKTIDQICNKNNSSTHLNFSYHVPFFLPLLEDDLQLSKKKRKKIHLWQNGPLRPWFLLMT